MTETPEVYVFTLKKRNKDKKMNTMSTMQEIMKKKGMKKKKMDRRIKTEE
jgi:hypothetical protein